MLYDCRRNYSVLTTGDEDAWVDICTTKDLEFNKPTYLIATNTTRFFKECRCFVNKGHFLLNVTDLRLKSMNGRNCSPAVLKINGNVFSCDIAQEDYGSTFNNKVLESPKKDLFISIRSLSDETLPDMIWLTLIPRGKLLFSYQRIFLNINFFQLLHINLICNSFLRNQKYKV